MNGLDRLAVFTIAIADLIALALWIPRSPAGFSFNGDGSSDRQPQFLGPAIRSSPRHCGRWMLMGIKIPSQDGLDKGEVLLAILLFSLCMWALVWEFTRAVLQYF
jgi:hypothetical protein